MNPAFKLHQAGQSLWLDNITRQLLDGGGLAAHIELRAVTGLTSNPTIFDKAIESSAAYDSDIAAGMADGLSSEETFFRLAIVDLTRAADLFLPVHQRTAGVDGWVSLEVSPLLVDDGPNTIEAAVTLHHRAERENLFIKIPGTPAGLQAIEESIFRGVPVNVTLLFSAAQYLAAAEAYMTGLERRVAAGLAPDVPSVASVFVSRWDTAVKGKVPDNLHDMVGIAAAHQAYRSYRRLLDSERWQRLANAGARAQRILFASTSTKDPSSPDILYVKALAAPHTINTMPEETLVAFADHGQVGEMLAADGGDSELVLGGLAAAGMDPQELATQLQLEGGASFAKSWRSLIACIDGKRTEVRGGV
ncbi:MAG TPA: transaldolase [Candidatus Dormibacteraeota bacterium]|nr:transaldolase [Candidatus Dormibacteraeota bacterium]